MCVCVCVCVCVCKVQNSNVARKLDVFLHCATGYHNSKLFFAVLSRDSRLTALFQVTFYFLNFV